VTRSREQAMKTERRDSEKQPRKKLRRSKCFSQLLLSSIN